MLTCVDQGRIRCGLSNAILTYRLTKFSSFHDKNFSKFGVKRRRCRLASSTAPVAHQLFDAGPLHPACNILDEHAISPACDVHEYIPGHAKYVQGRATTKERRDCE